MVRRGSEKHLSNPNLVNGGLSSAPDGDGHLVARFLEGEEQAFDQIFERHRQKVFQLVWGIVGDWHVSEDVCQEVFTVVYRKLSMFKNQSLFSTWLHRIAVNAALKARQRRKNAPGVTLEDLHEPEAAPMEAAGFEGNEVVVKLLQPLPENLRIAVALREVGGWSYEEIARILRCSRGSVEQRLHRGMNMLREIWKHRLQER